MADLMDEDDLWDDVIMIIVMGKRNNYEGDLGDQKGPRIEHKD